MIDEHILKQIEINNFQCIGIRGDSYEVISSLYFATHAYEYDYVYFERLYKADAFSKPRLAILEKIMSDIGDYEFVTDYGTYSGNVLHVLEICIFYYKRGDVIMGTCNGDPITSKELLHKYRLQALI